LYFIPFYIIDAKIDENVARYSIFSFRLLFVIVFSLALPRLSLNARGLGLQAGAGALATKIKLLLFHTTVY
jgi:hypothetical protein